MIFLFMLFLIPINVFASDTSKASIVMDVDSGRILYSKNKDEKSAAAAEMKKSPIDNRNKLILLFFFFTVTIFAMILSFYSFDHT